MRTRDEVLEDLKIHSVRIKQGDLTIGTGFLIVPEDGESAYIITAAHVFQSTDYPVVVQCYVGAVNGDVNEGRIIINQDEVQIHDAYDPEKNKFELQNCDVAVICINKCSWMSGVSSVFWGELRVGMPIVGIAYSGSTFEENIKLDSNRLYSFITNWDKEKKLMTSVLEGDLKINLSDSDDEIGGMSGCVYVADRQDQIILIGMFCWTPVNNDPLSRMYLIGMNAAKDLLYKNGVECKERPVIAYRDELSDQVLLKTIMTESRFVHRETEMDQMKTILDQHNMVILSGMGGIGKTELARQYLQNHRTEFTSVLEVNCKKSILEGFSEIKVRDIERICAENEWETNEQLGQRVLDWFKVHGEYDCLFLLDDVVRNDSALQQVVELPQKKIITSRDRKKVWGGRAIDVHELNSAEQRQLFEAYMERELEEGEIPVFENISEIISGHTLTLQLIALQCSASNVELEDIYESLQTQGIYTDDPNYFFYGESSEEYNMYGHIRAIWNMVGLSENEKRIMQGLSLIPSYSVSRDEFQMWLELENQIEIYNLIQKGWIQEYRKDGKNQISLHMVVADVVYRELYQKEEKNLGSMIRSILKEASDRSLDYECRVRYINYGVQISERINVSQYAIYFIQKISEEVENIREYDTGIYLLQISEKHLHTIDKMESILAADNYNDMALMYQGKTDWEKMFQYFDLAGVVYSAVQEQYPKNYGLHFHNVARAYQMVGKFKVSWELEQIAEQMLKKYGLDELGKVYDAMANCKANEISEIVAKQKRLNGTFLSEKDFKKKIRNLLEQERTFWKKAVDTKKEYAPDDEREIMISKEGLAATESLLGNTAEGIRILNETLDFFKRTTKDDSESVANVYVYLCLAYEKADRLSESLKAGREAIRICKLCKSTSLLETAYHNTKITCERMGLDQEAEIYKKEIQELKKMEERKRKLLSR